MRKTQLSVQEIAINELKLANYNPRKWDKLASENLKESIRKYGLVDPLIVNGAKNRKNVIIGGHFRWHVAKDMGFKTIPVVCVDIPEIEREKELNLRLNKNTGEWDWKLLAEFDQKLLSDIGFDSEEIDDIFGFDDNPEQFDLEKELKKLNINKISIQKGDVYDLDGSRLCCGDSTVEEEVHRLFGDQKADMCLTDPPYILDYLNGKKIKQ